MKILEARKISRQFGGLRALNNVSFSINEGEIFGIIGPNGAGKTTLFNVISGAFKPTGGSIFYRSEDITGLSMHQVAKRGLVRTFQASVIWKEETVLDNVLLSSFLHRQSGLLDWFANTRKAQKEEEILREKAEKIIGYMRLGNLRDELAVNLPHGKTRALGICIALMSEPKIILLDEPVTGMNPVEKNEIVELLKGLREKGLTIAIIEHDMATVMNLVDRIIVLNHGELLVEGLPEEIKMNKMVIDAYLGTGKEES